jgi:hypothetical protein
MSWRKSAYRSYVRLRRRLLGIPQPGAVDFGDLRRLAPVSRHFGVDRGTALDRYYIEGFLARHATDVRGRCPVPFEDRLRGHQIVEVTVVERDRHDRPCRAAPAHGLRQLRQRHDVREPVQGLQLRIETFGRDAHSPRIRRRGMHDPVVHEDRRVRHPSPALPALPPVPRLPKPASRRFEHACQAARRARAPMISG